MSLVLIDGNFEDEVIKSQKPILVDFWAPWCAPCQMMAPILEEISKEFGEKIKIGKLDVDQNSSIAAKFSINAIPALILFKEGKVVKKIIGVQSKEVIVEAIESVIGED